MEILVEEKKGAKTPFAERIGGALFGKSTTLYKFEKIKRAKAKAKQLRPEVAILDMGVGEPDQMANESIITTLHAAAMKPENRGYADNGGRAFKEAVAEYMKKVFGIQLDAADEVVHCVGAKSALSLLPIAFINPADVVLFPTPGYPVLATHARNYGAAIHPLPLRPENGFLPDLESVPEAIAEKTKILLLNYPHNPTGACATRAFFEAAVAWAKRWGTIIIQDAAYAGLVYENEEPLSILSVPGGKDVAIEVHSLSKAFSMTGWRLGWVCGNKDLVAAFAHVKDYSDSGQFLAIQAAGCAALERPHLTKQAAAHYAGRMERLMPLLQDLGFVFEKPKAGFFLYAKAPKAVLDKATQQKIDFENAEAFSTWLIENASISTVPWDEVGAFIRFSVTFEAEGHAGEMAFFEELRARLEKYQFSF